MKFLILLTFAVVFGINMVLTKSGARVCVIRNNCTTTSPNVCARYGRSNLCKKFSNSCTYEASKCSSTTYTLVNSTLCSSISVNKRRRCGGSSSSSSSIFGSTSSSSSNVTPIIIRV